jgi:type IV pilus assembly protein PilM
MDLKKEIKLSDLVPKRASKEKAPKATKNVKSAKSAKSRDKAGSEIVGLKIGATGMRVAHVVNNGGKQLVRTAHAPLANGIVDGGEVRDPTALGEALAYFFEQNNLPRKGVRLGLSNSRIGVRVIDVAGIDDDRQLENAIGFRAHEMLSVPIEEAVIDYRVLSTDKDEDGQITRRILVVVAYRDSIDRYLAATDAAKIELAGIDLEAFALLRAVAEPGALPVGDDGRPVAALSVVSVGHERTTLAVSDGSVCEFARVLEWGGAQIGSAIARALKLSPTEGEELKHGVSLVEGSEGVEGLPAGRSAEVVEAVRYEMQSLVRDLLSSLRFYQSQPSALPIGEILVTGGTASIPGFAEELGRELGIPVRLADPFVRVHFPEGAVRPKGEGALAIAVGLGIED